MQHHTTRRLTLLALAACTSSIVAAPPSPLSPAEVAAGWTFLFDGTSTDAWRSYRGSAFPEKGWVVENGWLRVTAGGGAGDIITKAQYENFELAFEWKTSPGANSGVMYRVTEEYGASWQSGPEMQVLDDSAHDFPPTDSKTSGGLYALYDNPDTKVLEPAGKVNYARIVMQGGVVKHYLNGVKMVEADLNSSDWRARVSASKFAKYEGFGTRAVGHICLQDHGNDVWFRNIRIRNLDAPMPGEIDLLAGDRLDQWTAHLKGGATLEDVFRFEDGVVVCAGQPVGYMRTNATYTNFVLRLQWRFDPVTKKAGNSGVLVRMIEEDKVWPRSIEAQLQSGRAGDFWNIEKFEMSVETERTKGRNTRHTHSNERPVGEWNDYEIIVDGGRVTLVVNDEVLNEAWHVAEIGGKICLQSEGAPIHFRRVRLAEIR